MANIISFIIDPEFSGIWLALKISFILISFLLLIGVVFFSLKSTWLKSKYTEDYTEFFTYRPYGVKKEFKRWMKVIKRIDSGKEIECKMAVIEADDLVKEVFQKMNYEGDFLDDILDEVDPKVLPSLDKLKEVHKIRNDIVHSPDYQLTVEQARNIIRIYQQALMELEMF